MHKCVKRYIHMHEATMMDNYNYIVHSQLLLLLL